MPTRSSNTKVKRCPTPTTTDCVEWVAGDFSCLDICNGDILSDAQFNIATQICNLISATDLSSVTIPDCLKTAWATNDPTILNFIQFLLDKHCEQQAQIDSLGENELTLETVFTVNYPDCCVSECQPSIELTIQQHFEKVLECLCQQYARIVALEAIVGDTSVLGGKTISQLLIEIQTTANQADTNATDWLSKKPCIIAATGC
jgi:hypothetical protein